MKWVRVLRERNRELWRLVHSSGAVLVDVEMWCVGSMATASWAYTMRWIDIDRVRESPNVWREHAREHRETRARIHALMEQRYGDDPAPPSLAVEPIKRESRRKRRAKKRAVPITDAVIAVDRAALYETTVESGN